MDIFTTAILNKVVEYLDRSASFLLDTFFPSVQTEVSEEIHFDIDKSKARLAPFVSPLVAGKVVDDEGYETKSFKPAYVKDKRHFSGQLPLKRSIGEKIGGSLSPQRRMEAAVNRALRDQLANLTRREEVMASEALRLGKVTVSGDNYPSQVVNFGRNSALTIALTSTAKWGTAADTSTAVPLDNLESWSGLLQEKSGGVARTVVMDPKAWSLFRKSKDVKDKLEIRRGTNASLNADPITRGQGNEKARYIGSIGDFDIWVYQDTYINDSGSSTKLLPDYTVLLASREHLEGVRCYGMIQDEKAGFRALRYFTKSWIEEDPAVRWLLMQSAPLVVPYRPNASLCATVHS